MLVASACGHLVEFEDCTVLQFCINMWKTHSSVLPFDSLTLCHTFTLCSHQDVGFNLTLPIFPHFHLKAAGTVFDSLPRQSHLNPGSMREPEIKAAHSKGQCAEAASLYRFPGRRSLTGSQRTSSKAGGVRSPDSCCETVSNVRAASRIRKLALKAQILVNAFGTLCSCWIWLVILDDEV